MDDIISIILGESGLGVVVNFLQTSRYYNIILYKMFIKKMKDTFECVMCENEEDFIEIINNITGNHWFIMLYKRTTFHIESGYGSGVCIKYPSSKEQRSVPNLFVFQTDYRNYSSIYEVYKWLSSKIDNKSFWRYIKRQPSRIPHKYWRVKEKLMSKKDLKDYLDDNITI